MLRPCLGLPGEPCGELTPSRRCSLHTRQYEARRPSRRVLGRYDTKYLKLRRRVLQDHPWCAVCRGPATPSDPLTVDHIVPLSRGGKNVISNMQAMHRSCNSAKRDRVASPST